VFALTAAALVPAALAAGGLRSATAAPVGGP
jgi:hypothetical protein